MTVKHQLSIFFYYLSLITLFHLLLSTLDFINNLIHILPGYFLKLSVEMSHSTFMVTPTLDDVEDHLGVE